MQDEASVKPHTGVPITNNSHILKIFDIVILLEFS